MTPAEPMLATDIVVPSEPALSTPVIELKGVTFSYGGPMSAPVLRDFSCATGAPGRFVGIMGPSGSGKSTLLHLCGGLITPQSGELRVLGTDLAKLSDADRTVFRRDRVGFVFQFFHLLPTLTVLENVLVQQWMNGARRTTREAVTRATTLLERLGIAARAKHLPSELSGGEAQRVAIARALFHRPGLILADEPTGNLDRATKYHVYALLREVALEFDTCVLMATHDVDCKQFLDVCHRIEESRLGLEV